nr:MAG TPA: hypothetical protein [Caudoviricetes sp.]
MKAALAITSIVAVLAIIKAIANKFAIMGLVHLLIEKYGEDAVNEVEIRRHINYCARRWFSELVTKERR